jgi:hypothetical protein
VPVAVLRDHLGHNDLSTPTPTCGKARAWASRSGRWSTTSRHCRSRGKSGLGRRAVTRYNVAMIYRAQGQLGRAVAELEQVVELDRQVGHPDLHSDTAMLHHVRQELASPDLGSGSP